MIKHKLMIDSGAFSAKTSQINLRPELICDQDYLDEYIQFCLNNMDWIEYFVNLDVIPIDPSYCPIKKDGKKTAEEGWRNYWYMVDQGVPKEKLVHVFHRDEPFEYLEKMVQNIPYIGLSPGQTRTRKNKIKWLDKCMQVICDRRGYPKVKFHGFAVTSVPLMCRYPWYSVDSSAWLQISNQGLVLVPKTKNGKWDFTQVPHHIGVTSRCTKNQIRHLSQTRKQLFHEYIKYQEFKLGVSTFHKVPKGYKRNQRKEIWYKKDSIIERVRLRGLTNDFRERNGINAAYYNSLAKQLPKWPWPFEYLKKRGLF